MTYRQPAVCRDPSCCRQAVAGDGLPEGDRGWCDQHLNGVRARRAQLVAVNAKWKPGKPAITPARDRR